MSEPYTALDMTDPNREHLFTTDYLLALGLARALPALRTTVEPYQLVFGDAWRIVTEMNPAAFNRFRTGLLQELGGREAGEEWTERFGSLYVPTNAAIISAWMDHSGDDFRTAVAHCLAQRSLVIGTSGELRVGFPPGSVSGDGSNTEEDDSWR